MNELLQKLNTAHRVCVEVDEHYTAISSLQQQIEVAKARGDERKGMRNFACFVLFIVICEAVILPFLRKISEGLASTAVPVFWLLYIAAFFFIRYKTKAAAKETINRLGEQIEEHRAAAQKIFDANAEDMAVLPADYWYPMAIDYLSKMIQTGRAATLSEALDKYDEQVHRWKLEEASAQMLALQQQQAAQLANIQRNTEISAVADVVTAAINISNSW